MKDVLSLLYFVFAIISAYGVIGLISWVVNALKDTNPFENPEDEIFHIAKFSGYFSVLEVGLVGLFGTFCYQIIFL